MLLTFHLRGIPGSGSWLLHQRVAHAMILLFPVREQMKVWGICVRCPGTRLRLLEESVYLKNLWFHFPWPASVRRLASLRNGTHSHYFSSLDQKANGCLFKTGAPRAQSPGSLSQLAFRFTCNHDNAIDASYHGT